MWRQEAFAFWPPKAIVEQVQNPDHEISLYDVQQITQKPK